MAHSSKISLHPLGSPQERAAKLIEEGWLDADAYGRVQALSDDDWLGILDGGVENVIGPFRMPLSVATGFVINGREALAPMVTEERTVVAAASKAAKLCRPYGFKVKVRPAIAVGQMFYPRPDDPESVMRRVKSVAPEIIAELRKEDRMTARGGGPLSLDARLLESGRGPILVIEVWVDVRDAMGANAATETGHRAAALLKGAIGMLPMSVICGNDVPERYATARAVWGAEELGTDLVKRLDRSFDRTERIDLGHAGMRRILDLHAWAVADPTRAVTHMKGVMNGVTAVALAAGQDTRALEAAVWTQACRSGRCLPLTEYGMTKTGRLYGRLDIPLVAGTVGGATGHPMARVARSIGGIRDAEDLVGTMAAVGLAQNFAALWSLAHEGIIASHEKLGRKKT